ncbi:MAG: beta-glucanase, partial [Flavobacteriales bacterium]|nr:beta-glucanase [Flavobacteriales bacterium]
MKPNNLLYSILFFVIAIHTNAQNWNLVWADEFETEGSIDDERWFQQSQLPNGYSWYNNELQHYTDRIENSYVSNGTLKIVAKKENYTDQGHTKQYTSARLNSKFSFTYGKVEVRAKLPFGQGTWPAIWTLGKNVIEPGGYWTNQGYGSTSWPNCGEIDIMEHWGINQNYIQSATHTPSSFGGTINHGGQNISTASSEFHTYGLIWTEDQLIFSVDDQVHFTYNPPVKDSETWPFDAEQYLLMNIAIDQNITSDFQQSTLEVDYVRVYQSTSSEQSIVNFTVDMNGLDYPS